MILTTLASIFLNGIAIMVGTLSVMRLLYRFGICEPPRLANGPVENHQTREARPSPPLSDLTSTGAPLSARSD
jgi:hypothetical protein